MKHSCACKGWNFWAILLLTCLTGPACQDYGGSGDCEGLDCKATCLTDGDCPSPLVCVSTHGGCCSGCQVYSCTTDTDCRPCQACDRDSGTCLALPCDSQCSDESQCPPNSICVTDAAGCCGRCEALDPCADLQCISECQTHSDCAPNQECETDAMGCCGRCRHDGSCDGLNCAATCVMDADCPPEAVCHVFADGCCSECRLADQEVELMPACAHAPYLVGAGAEFPLALFGRTECAWFDRVEVAAEGFDITVRVMGRTSADPDCPQLTDCDFQEWTYLGLVWLQAPNPGVYTITVGGAFTLTVGASGGIVEPPACQDDCPSMALESNEWDLVHLSEQRVRGKCGYRDLDLPLVIEGACQDLSIESQWPFPSQVKHCTDRQLLFGQGPFHQAEASRCPISAGSFSSYVLGIGTSVQNGQEASQVFLWESR